jgi:hypothetical protein
VLHAAAQARANGSDLVFLVADADDWPRRLYERFGFDTIGRYGRFLQAPPARGFVALTKTGLPPRAGTKNASGISHSPAHCARYVLPSGDRSSFVQWPIPPGVCRTTALVRVSVCASVVVVRRASLEPQPVTSTTSRTAGNRRTIGLSRTTPTASSCLFKTAP